MGSFSFKTFVFAGSGFLLGFSLNSLLCLHVRTSIYIPDDDGHTLILDEKHLYSDDNNELKLDIRKEEPSSSVNQNPEPVMDAASKQKQDQKRQQQQKQQKPQKQQSKNIETKVDSTEKLTTDLSRGVCSAISSSFQSTSSTSIWKDSLEKVISGSKHFRDFHKYNFHDFHVRMLHYLTPQRFQSSVKALPFNQWEKVGSILDVAFERYKYLQAKENNNGNDHEDPPANADEREPRKVKILVIGGSVTAGVFCQVNPVMKRSGMKRLTCCWGTRLGIMLDAQFPGVFQIDVAAFGGTNTRGATAIWEYDLFEEDVPNPDIVINSFSTNDMHVMSVKEAELANMTLEDAILDMNQEFIRKVLKPRSNCDERPTPLLLYLDDYLGNEQKGIMDTLAVNSALHKLSSYYGFGFMSYADIVRDFVYSNPEELWFSPSLWPERQIHHSSGGHIAIMWVVAYNLLNLATVYCESLKIGPEHIYEAIGGLPNLQTPEKEIIGEPRPKPRRVLPPEMNYNLTLDNVSARWHERDNSTVDFDEKQCPLQKEGRRRALCHFRLFWKLSNNMTEVMEPFVVENNGWEESDGGKRGLAPTKANATLQLRFDNITDQIQTLNFVAMKSYGDKWAGSKIAVEAFVNRKHEQDINAAAMRLGSLDIVGFHQKNTSESYDYKMDLGEERVLPGDVLNVYIRLIGGTKAKIMGMLFCRT